jgi:hypothetical protein
MDAEGKQNLVSTGSIIALTTIGSFVASSAYVVGLSFGLRQPVYEFFELKDYLEVTPVWLLPTAIYLLITGFMLLFLPPIITIREIERSRWQQISSCIFLFGPFLLLIVLRWIGVLNDDIACGFVFLHAFFLLGSLVAFLILYEKRLVGLGLGPEQKGLRFVLMTIILAFFLAFNMGYNWSPRWVRLSQESTVIVGDVKGDTKDQEVHGKIVLHLERYLLLQDGSGHLVGIPTYRIKWIDSPPFPTPSPSPTSDPNSIN